MKRIAIELSDGYDEVLSITAMGWAASLPNEQVNVMSRVFELSGHDGDLLVIHPYEAIEWRKPTTATWEWFEEHSGRSLYDDDDIIDLGWRCSCCKKPLAESVGGYWDEFENKPNLKFCPECGERMVV